MATKKTRAVIVGGARTPFVKAFGEFIEMDTIALGVAAVRGLLDRLDLPYREVESLVWGGVILPGTAPNVGREIVLDLGLDPGCEAFTVTRACASGLQAVTLAAAAIERGEADVVIAGGSDSTSNAEVKLPQKLIHAAAPIAFGKGTPADYLGMIQKLAPFTDLLPRQPKIAERSTGEVMGEAAERMARRNEIPRDAQDEFAVQSHHRAAAAIASGRFDDEVVPVQTPHGRWVHADGLVRADTSVDKLERLRPVFAKDGTLTAGNSSALTDGAAAVLLMSEEKAKALGLEPLAAFRSLGLHGRGPGGPAVDGAGARDAEGARARGARARRGRLGGHARGVRGAGAEHREDAGQRRLRPRAAGPRKGGRQGRPGAAQRSRRLARPRSSLRRHRRPHGDHDGERASQKRQEDRAARHLRRRRPGGGGSHGAGRIMTENTWKHRTTAPRR